MEGVPASSACVVHLCERLYAPQMFSSLLLDVEHEAFEHALEAARKDAGAEFDRDLTAEQLKSLVEVYKSLVLEATGKPFPEDPMEQLEYAIKAVFSS